MDALETKIFIELIVGAVLLATVILFFIFSHLRHQKRFKKLNQEQINIQVQTLDQERERMAADLHDEFGSVLSGFKMQLANLSTRTIGDQMIIENLNTNITVLMDRVREISRDLMPSVLQRKGFEAALNAYIKTVFNPASVAISFRVLSETAIPLVSANHLYRISLELLNNALKYAEAREINILLNEDKTTFQFIMEDNGKGFDVGDELENLRGTGLANVANRTKLINGKAVFTSNNKSGTTFTLSFPKVS